MSKTSVKMSRVITSADPEFPEWKDEEQVVEPVVKPPIRPMRELYPTNPYVDTSADPINEQVTQKTMKDLLKGPPVQGDFLYVTPTRPLQREHLAQLSALSALGFNLTSIAAAKQVLSFMVDARAPNSLYNLISQDMSPEEWAQTVAMASKSIPDDLVKKSVRVSMRKISAGPAATILRGLRDAGFDIDNPKKGKALVLLSQNPNVSGLSQLSDEQWMQALGEGSGEQFREEQQSLQQSEELGQQEYMRWQQEHPANEFTPTPAQEGMGMKPNAPGSAYQIKSPGQAPLPPEKVLTPVSKVPVEEPQQEPTVLPSKPAPPQLDVDPNWTSEELLQYMKGYETQRDKYMTDLKKHVRMTPFQREELAALYNNNDQRMMGGIPEGARILPSGTLTKSLILNPDNRKREPAKTGQFVYDSTREKGQKEALIIGIAGENLLVQPLRGGEKEIWSPVDPITKKVLERSRSQVLPSRMSSMHDVIMKKIGCTLSPSPLELAYTNIPHLFSKEALEEHYKLYVAYRNKLGGNVLEPEQKYAYAGAVLHEIFFTGLTREKTVAGMSSLVSKITRVWGSVDTWWSHMSALAKKSSGWVILSRTGDKLLVTAQDEHDGFVPGLTPICAIDVYEHAYFKDFGTDKLGYMKAIRSHLNWEEMSKRYDGIWKEAQVGGPDMTQSTQGPQVNLQDAKGQQVAPGDYVQQQGGQSTQPVQVQNVVQDGLVYKDQQDGSLKLLPKDQPFETIKQTDGVGLT